MFRRFKRSSVAANATSKNGVESRNLLTGCWPCRLRSKPCSVTSVSIIRVCSNCREFNIKCVGVGEDLPVGKGAKRAAKAMQVWIVDGANHKSDVPPFDLSYFVPLVITVEAVAVQEAFEKHGKPPESLRDAFDYAMSIAKRAHDSEKFSATLMLIANQSFATCRLLLLCVTPEESSLPSHLTERVFLSSGVLVLSTILRRTCDLLDMGPLENTSATEQVLGIILACITDLGGSLREVKEALNSEHGKTTTLRDLDTIVRGGTELGLRTLKESGPIGSGNRSSSRAPSVLGQPIVKPGSPLALDSGLDNSSVLRQPSLSKIPFHHLVDEAYQAPTPSDSPRAPSGVPSSSFSLSTASLPHDVSIQRHPDQRTIGISLNRSQLHPKSLDTVSTSSSSIASKKLPIRMPRKRAGMTSDPLRRTIASVDEDEGTSTSESADDSPRFPYHPLYPTPSQTPRSRSHRLPPVVSAPSSLRHRRSSSSVSIRRSQLYSVEEYRPLVSRVHDIVSSAKGLFGSIWNGGAGAPASPADSSLSVSGREGFDG